MRSPSKYLVVTNNPLVLHRIPKEYEIDYIEGGYRDVLVAVRDMVFSGHYLYTHPLSGSVKPNETPYKSILVSKRPFKMRNEDSILMSESMETFDKFKPRTAEWPERVLKDFRLIDYALICGALELDAVAGLSD